MSNERPPESKPEGITAEGRIESRHPLDEERRWRLRIIFLAFPVVLAVVLYLFRPAVIWSFPDLHPVPFPWAILTDTRSFSLIESMLMLVGLANLTLVYLQTGFRREHLKDIQPDRVLLHNEAPAANTVETTVAADVAELKRMVASLVPLEMQKTPVLALSDEERIRLVEGIATGLSNSAANAVLETWRREFAARDVTFISANLVDRLRRELASLSFRSNLNLVIGFVTTIAGVLALGYFVLYRQPTIDPVSGNPWWYLAEFAPRLSLVVVIEVFAYFFLRLYKAGLGEIKYFQNELTNIEARLFAFKAAVERGDSSTAAAVLTTLGLTERNYLKSGESTIEIESSKQQSATLKEITKGLGDLLKTAKSQAD